METLLGVSIDAILAVSASAVLSVLAVLLVAVARRPLLARLAVRSPRRRPAQSLLITLGLTLSTVIVATAFNTGDTMTHTVRSLVASGLGRADEVVLALPRDQRRSPGEYLAALLNGSLLTGLGGYFPQAEADRLRAATADDARIAGLLPAIGDQVTVVNLDLHSAQSQVAVLAIPSEYPAVFGALIGPDSGQRTLDELADGQLFASQEAAAQLGAGPGSRLELHARGGTLPVVVRDVVDGRELSGVQPTLYLPLGAYQQAIGRGGSINQILVANRGESTTSVRSSAEVARVLRVALADRRAIERAFGLLRSEAARAEIGGLARAADGRAREKLEALAGSLTADRPSDDFISVVTDPDVERRLIFLVGRLAGASGAGFAPPFELAPLRVLEVKQASQDQADRWGGALTSAFLILGLFSLATGALLVFLIFLTLAAERRSELGVLRALGARRRDVVVTFLLEGAIYDLAASAVGLGLGVLVALAITAAGDAALSQYGVRLQARLEPRSLAVAYCLGLLMTFLSVGYSAWHISRLSVVTAIRNLPEPPRRRRRLWSAVVWPALALVGPAFAWLGLSRGWPLAQALGVALGIVGFGLLVRQVLGLLRLKATLRDRLAYTAAGVGLLAYWLAPAEWPLLSVLRPPPRSIELFFVSGLSIVLGAVWVAMYNLGLLSGPLVAATARLRAFGLAVRTASANPLHYRFRTGMIVAMFALVLFSMVVAGVLLTATHRAYDDPEALAGGFDLRVDVARPAESPNLAALLPQASAARADDFAAVGRLASRTAQVVELGTSAGRWRSYALNEIDAGFAGGLRSPLAARADGFGSDAELWETVVNRPGFAVVGGPAVGSRQIDPTEGGAFRFVGFFQDETRFRPREVWVRDERGGRPTRLTVIGVLDPRLSIGSGLYAGPATFAVAEVGPPRSIAFYLKAREGADPTALALGLNLSFEQRGLRATALGEDIRRMQSVRSLLNQLLQGFFGVGLLAGLAALGVITMRAVVERRQQIGMLRALGFRREMVRLSLLLETSLIALLGIGIGLVLGLALAQRLVEYLARQYPEIVFGVPWDQLGLIALGAYLASLLLATLPLYQIGRIEPAEALKYE